VYNSLHHSYHLKKLLDIYNDHIHMIHVLLLKNTQ